MFDLEVVPSSRNQDSIQKQQAALPKPEKRAEPEINILSSDIVKILSISRDPKIPISILYMLEHFDNPKKLSKNELRIELQNLSPEGLLDRIKKAAYKDLTSNLFGEYLELAYALESKHFKELYLAIKNSSYQKDIDSPALIAYKIFNKSLQQGESLPLAINLIQSPEFAKFLSDLKQKYNLNSFDDLDSLLDWYQSPRHIELLKTKKLQDLFNILFQELPDVEKKQISALGYITKLTNITSIFTVKDLPLHSFRERVKQVNAFISPLASSFEAKAINHLELLRLEKDYPETSEMKFLYQAIKKNPDAFSSLSLIERMSLLKHTFHQQYFETLELKENDLKKIQVGLGKFGFKFSDFGNLSLLPIDDFEKLGIIKKDLADNFASKKFADFAEKLKEKYPEACKHLQISDIFRLANCSVKEKQFWALNSELEKLNGSPLQRLETCLNYADLKIEILKKHNELKLTGIKVTPEIKLNYFGHSGLPLFNKGELESILKLLEDPKEIKIIHELFTKKYKIETFDLSLFHHRIYSDAIQNRYDENYRMERVAEVKKLLAKSFHDTKAVNKSFSDFSFLTESMREIEEVKLSSLSFNFKEIAAYLPVELSEKIYDGKQIDLEALNYVLQIHSGLFSNTRGYQEIAETLKSKPYNLTKEETINYLHQKNLDRVKENISALVPIFNKIMGIYPKESKLDNLKLAENIFNLKISVNTEEFQTLIKFHEMGFSILRKANRTFFNEEILTDTALIENLNNPQFQKFVKEMITTYYHNDFDPELLKEFSILFSEQKEAVDQIFSGKFNELFKYIQSEFDINFIHPSIFESLLNIHNRDKFEELKKFIKLLRDNKETVFANDLIAITEIVNNPKLYNLVTSNYQSNKEEIIKIIKTKYLPLRGEIKEREAKDYVEAIDKLIEETRAKKDLTTLDNLISKRTEYLQQYTERPQLKDLPYLQLYRIAILFQELLREEVGLPERKPTLLDQIAKIVKQDLANDKTELGGQIQVINGEVSFVLIDSISHHNEAYGNEKYNFLTNGLATFHLHATKEDNSNFAGPSGTIDMIGADFSQADLYNGTDIVITTLGRPKNGNRNELLINIDLYFADKRTPQTKGVIYDLGIYRITLPNK